MGSHEKINHVIASSLDTHAKSFGMKLDSKSHALIVSYLVSCTCKLVSIAKVLVDHASKSSIDVKDVHALKALSKLFLSVEPVQRGLSGGAETTLPSEYFGHPSSAYSSSAGNSHTNASTSALIRTELPASVIIPLAGGGANNFDSEFSTESTVSSEIQFTGGMSGGGEEGISALSIAAFRVILSCKEIPPHPTIKDDAIEALRYIVNCNLLHLTTRIKSERKKKKSPSKRGAPVSTAVVRSAINGMNFIIPI